MISDNRTNAIVEFDIEWRGTAIGITHVLRQIAGIDHIEVQSANDVPLPISEASYKSHFTTPDTLADQVDAAAYVLAWLVENCVERGRLMATAPRIHCALKAQRL